MPVPNYEIPWRGEQFRLRIALSAQANGNTFQAAPTLAAGDFKRSIGTESGGSMTWGAFANLDNLPSVQPAGGKVVELLLSATETDCDLLSIIASDAAGAEWRDIHIEIKPVRPGAPVLNRTTIATLASQTSFTLSAGSADDNAYVGALAIIEDGATAVQKGMVAINLYTGSTKTVGLVAAAPFTIATGDRVVIVGQNLASATVGNLTNAPTNGDLTAAMKASVNAEVDAALDTAIPGTPTANSVNERLKTLDDAYTAARAAYLDNLNVGGAVASQADINALNQSASRRIIATTVGQYERPESGTTPYTVEVRTYDEDGAAVNADSNPTLTATGIISGDLSANLSAISNPSTGVYRWTYTVSSAATVEQVRFDASATISSSSFPITVYTQVADFVAATFTTTDRSTLNAINAKTTNLPSDPADQSAVESAIASATSGLATAAALSSLAAIFSGITSLGNWLRLAFRKGFVNSTALTEINTGGTSALVPSTDALEALSDAIAGIEGGGGGSGTGDKLITVTVDDGTNPLANARITAWSNDVLAAVSDLTDVDGEATLNLSDGTYDIVIVLAGYSFPGDTLAVSANADVTYSMTLISISPAASPLFCILAIRHWRAGVVQSGVSVKVRVVVAPSGTGEMFDDDDMTDTTGADGYATFTVPRGCSVKYWIGNSEKQLDSVGTDDDVVYVENGLGHP